MFNIFPTDSVTPTLMFTKAELVYIVTVILADLKPTDDHTKIEMVELRHYINQIRDKVVMAAHSGELKNPSTDAPQKKKEDKPSKLPSVKELKEKFPNLTEVEIAEIIVNAKAEMESKHSDVSSEEDDDGSRQYDLGAGNGDSKDDGDKPHTFRITPTASPTQSEAVKFARLLGA
jgi:hypothetical protein